MLVVGLRAPIGSLLKDLGIYRGPVVLPYDFSLGSALITTMAILLAFYALLRWTDRRRRFRP